MTAADLISAVERIKVVELRPADVLVIEFPDRVPSDALARMSEVLREEFPGRRSLILHGGAKVAVITEVPA